MSAGPDPGTSPQPPRQDAVEVARRMLEGEAPALPPDTASRRAIGWALKDLCYRAWSTAPQRAVAAADCLRTLADASSDDEIRALAAWTSGIAALVRGDMADADRSLLVAADAFRSLGDAQHAAETEVPRIMALAMLGQHAQAADCAEATQRAFLALGDTAAAGKVSLNLGSLNLRRERYRDAARYYRDAVVLFARVGDRQHSIMADIGLADALTALGDFDEALRIYARARMRATTHGFPVLDAMVEESVAILELSRGRYSEALAGFEHSRRGYERLQMPQQLAIAEKQLGDAYLELNLLPESIRLFERVLQEFRALEMPDDAAWTLVQLGRALVLSGRAADATQSLTEAAAAFANSGNEVGAAAVSLGQAELDLFASRAAEAIVRAAAAADAFALAGLPERALRADVVRADALLALGRATEARALYGEALTRASAMELLSLRVRSLTGQGVAAVEAGDADGARCALVEAIERFEEMRGSLPGDEIRSAFLTDHVRPYRALLALTLVALPEPAGEAAAADVLMQLDRVRARSLTDRLERIERASPSAATTAKAARLRARLDWLYRRVRRLEEEGLPSSALAAELRATEHALLEHARRARLATASRAETSRASVPGDMLDVRALQASLAPDEVLIEYGVAGDELFACVVSNSGIVIERRIARWPEVVEALRSLRFQFDTLRHGTAHLERHLPTLTRRVNAQLGALHRMVWAPLAGQLGAASHILVVPHGELGNLPFAALTDGNMPIGFRHAIAVAPSARLVERSHRWARADRRRRRAVVLGDSTSLPHARAEAEAIAHLYGESSLLVGDDARADRLIAQLGGGGGGADVDTDADVDVIHLACHGQFRSDNPAFSALHLLDGALTAEAVESLRLGGATVVLSACETALARADRGDERIGLVRAFLAAGAATVVASLWPVDDQTTAQFMVRFHAELAAGASAATALTSAQRACRAEHPHPFYWAAFAAYGRS